MSAPLRILKPLTITTAMLTSCNVPETDYAEWDAATAYGVGNRVIRVSTHRIYERLVAGTTATAPESDPINWLDVGATNRWKMFDSIVNSQTTHTSSIVFTIKPGTVHNGVALIDLVATSVRVKQTYTNPTTLVSTVTYDKTIKLQAPTTSATWWKYIFEPIYMRQIALALDMPSYGRNTEVEITVTNTSGNPAIGAFLIGTSNTVGEIGVMSGAKVGITDYSRKERNQWGELTLVERSWAKRTEIDLIVPTNHLDSVQGLFASIRAKPVLFVADGRINALSVFGIYRDFSAVISYPQHAQMHLEIEGLT